MELDFLDRNLGPSGSSAAVKTMAWTRASSPVSYPRIGPPSGENEKMAVLEDIVDGYDTRNHQHDQYRVGAKSCLMVAKFPTPLRRAKDLLSTVGKISEKMLKRADEIIESGKSGGFLRHPSWIRSTVPARGPSRAQECPRLRAIHGEEISQRWRGPWLNCAVGWLVQRPPRTPLIVCRLS